MHETDDNTLISLAQNGDKFAEDALIQKYGSYVDFLSRPYSVMWGKSVHEDLVQIGFLGLLRAVRTYDTELSASFKTYAAHCVRNALTDEVRKMKRQGQTVELVGDETSSNEASISDKVVENEIVSAFYDAVAERFGERDKDVIKMYFSAMSYKDISDRLGMTTKDVDNTIQKIKKKIQSLTERII
jgi:RNA polymerase sporulation-specific sigma factor